jgi:hypothetical protein
MKNKKEDLEVNNIEGARAQNDKILGSDAERRLAEAMEFRRELVDKVDRGIAYIHWATEEASETIVDLLRSEDESIRLQAAKSVIEISLANKDKMLDVRQRLLS